MRFDFRTILLLGLLALTLTAAFWPVSDINTVDRGMTPVQVKAKTTQNTYINKLPTSASIQASHSRRSGNLAGVINLFPVQTWAPKQITREQPIQSPQPPPIPYVFAGRYQDEGQLMVFLMEGDTIHVVKEGETLPDGWKLTEIGPDILKLLFSPLNVIRTLPMSDLQR